MKIFFFKFISLRLSIMKLKMQSKFGLERFYVRFYMTKANFFKF